MELLNLTEGILKILEQRVGNLGEVHALIVALELLDFLEVLLVLDHLLREFFLLIFEVLTELLVLLGNRVLPFG